MSVVASHSGEERRRAENVAQAARLRPRWLRPALITAAFLAHTAALGGFLWFAAPKITPLDDIKVEIVPQGETTTQVSAVATPEAAPVVSADPAELAAPQPEKLDDPDVAAPSAAAAAAAPDLALPAPKVEASEAPPVAEERPQPPRIDRQEVAAEAREKLRREKTREAERRRAILALKRAKAEAHARMLAAHAQLGAPALRAGAKDGSGEAQRMSNAAYAALVSAEINRHKHYPESARAAGRQGVARVVFSIAASGAVTSHAIVKSSGDAAIDSEVRQMVAAAHPPPPPGGSFRGSISISFSLGR